MPVWNKVFQQRIGYSYHSLNLRYPVHTKLQTYATMEKHTFNPQYIPHNSVLQLQWRIKGCHASRWRQQWWWK